MAYLRSYLEKRGIVCQVRDLNIESRAYLLEVTGNKPLVDELFSQSCRTYLAEAMVWSWHDPEGPDGMIRRVQTHPSALLREFWQDMGITRLARDPLLMQASKLLCSWLLEKAREIVNSAMGWVGFSTTITNLAANLFLACHLKAMDPGLFIVMGGPEITARNAHELLNSFPYIDAVIPAPAYEPLANLVSDIRLSRTGPLPKGVWRRTKDGEIEFDDTRCWVALDELPPANWQEIDLNRYQPGFILRDALDISRWYPTIPLHTSQGCSYNLCDFCYNATLYPRFGVQSPKRVLAEITHQIDNVGSCGFFFSDFEFNASATRVKEISRLIRGLPDEIRFSAWLKLDKLDTDLLEAIYDAGGRQIFVGVEAVDDDLLRLMRKGYNARTGLEKLQMLYSFWEAFPDLRFQFNLITNYPGESLESVKNTLAQIAENPHLFCQRVASVVEFMLHEGTYAFKALASSAVGCMEPLLPPGANVRSYRYLFPRPGDKTLNERLEIWSAIRALVQRDA